MTQYTWGDSEHFTSYQGSITALEYYLHLKRGILHLKKNNSKPRSLWISLVRKAVSRQETPLGKAIKIILSIYPIRLRYNGEIEGKNPQQAFHSYWVKGMLNPKESVEHFWEIYSQNKNVF